jgi:hypothetical protein
MSCVGTKGQGWWRDYFSDHTDLKAKWADTYRGIGQSAKAKVYCINVVGGGAYMYIIPRVSEK